MTRILLTTDAVGGVWRYTLDLASAFAERGITPILAIIGPDPSAAQEAEARAIPTLELVRSGQPLDWTAPSPEALGQAANRIASLAAMLGVSSIHLHAPSFMGAFLGASMGASTGQARWPAPVVVVGHSCLGTWWRAMRDTPPPPDFAWRIEATVAGLRSAAALIAPTRAHADAMRAVYGPADIAVVHNGAAPQPRPSIPRDRAVLTAGRLWDEAKGAARLDAAAAGLGAPIRAAGSTAGPNGATIALPNLKLLGSLDTPAMAAAYASATVFAALSRYEPFGLSVLEAALAGMSLVLSDTPGFRELWEGAATFVSEAESLPEALHRALDTPNDGKAQARAAQYTIARMADQTLAIHRNAGLQARPADSRRVRAGGLT